MAATAQESVHISGLESTQAPRAKNSRRGSRGFQNSQRGAGDYKRIERRRPLHSHALNSSAPTHLESHAKERFSARFAGIQTGFYTDLTLRLLAQALLATPQAESRANVRTVAS